MGGEGTSMDDGARLTEAFDGAVTDISVSTDAMLWSPRRAAWADGVDRSTGPRHGVADLADDVRGLKQVSLRARIHSHLPLRPRSAPAHGGRFGCRDHRGRELIK